MLQLPRDRFLWLSAPEDNLAPRSFAVSQFRSFAVTHLSAHWIYQVRFLN